MWIEGQLARHLGPVSAPDTLWNEIRQRRDKRELRPQWVLWPAFATLLLIASAALVWQVTRARAATIDMAQLTPAELQSLADSSKAYDLVSDDPTTIRRWVKAKGGIEIELPQTRAANVELLGARLVPMRGALVAALAYRVNGEDASLLVSNKRFPVTARKHIFSGAETVGSKRLYSWDMRDQVYAIAFAGTGDMHAPCLLCHIRGL